MKTLIGYELKKLLIRKSTWLTFLALFFVQAFLGFSGYVGDLLDGCPIGYEQEAAEKIEGRTLDDTLLAEVFAAMAKQGELGENYRKSEEYSEEVLPYMDLRNKLMYAYVGAAQTADDVYQARTAAQEELYDAYGLTDAERKHWEKEEVAVVKPFVYEYSGVWESMVDMHGAYMTSMLITFFIAVCMVGVFTEEDARRTDQLLLCVKRGRGQLCAAKLIAGSLVTLAATVLLEGVYLLGHLLYYGADGFGESIQMGLAFCYPHALSVGQCALIMLGLLFLSSLVIGLAAMALAQCLHHSIGAMAILIAALFAARLVSFPVSWRLPSMLWNLIPINLLKLHQGFLELRLYAGLTGYQLAPLVWLLAGALAVWAAKRSWCRQQVGALNG